MSATGKQIIIFVLLSVLCVVLQQQIAHVVGLLLQMDVKVSSLFDFFTKHLGDWGTPLNKLLSLVIIPIAFGAVVAGGFWLVKHVSMPHTMIVVWVTWLVMLVTISFNYLENHSQTPAPQHSSQQE
jgi:hypothetical protein